MQSFEAYLAGRYLGTKKKGAFVRLMARLAHVGTAIGVFAMLVCTALVNGYMEEIQANLFRATSHFAISSATGDQLQDTEGALAAIRSTPGVVGASPTRQEFAMIMGKGIGAPATGLTMVAVDPGSAGATTTIFDTLRPIRIQQLQEGQMVMGDEAARRLGVAVGDNLVLTFARLDLGLGGPVPRTMALRIAGVFHSGIADYDQSWGYLHLEDAKALAQTDQAEFIVVRTKSLEDIDRVKPLLKKRLDPFRYHILDLRENGSNRELFAAMKVQKWVFTAILSLLVIVAAFNIVACLVTLVAEKRRDLGILLSLGATPAQVQRTFQLQSLRMAGIGTLWGLGVGIPACLICDHWRLITLPASVYNFITYLPFRIHVTDLVLIAIFPMVVAWWAARVPARKASGTDPVDALRAD